MSHDALKKLGLPGQPLILAPLAGVSDHPFRRICARQGADLTYVEMISATAMIFESRRTFEMLKRHESESILGVQLTGKSADETARAVAILGAMPFDTIDINMGCPVAKVVKTGCGSAILRDPQRVFETVRLASAATDKPLSVKIRIGWDRASVNAVEVASAAEAGGAAWVTVHGRTRSDDYATPVDLDEIARVKKRVNIPVFGNGNIFGADDAAYMRGSTGVDGIMVSRGALGDPWVFARLKGQGASLTLDEWFSTIMDHLSWQREEYGSTGKGAVCMRKHLLWYLKGWPGVRASKDALSKTASIEEAEVLIHEIFANLKAQGVENRHEVSSEGQGSERFKWDPKWDMDRELDRGVGDDRMVAE